MSGLQSNLSHMRGQMQQRIGVGVLLVGGLLGLGGCADYEIGRLVGLERQTREAPPPAETATAAADAPASTATLPASSEGGFVSRKVAELENEAATLADVLEGLQQRHDSLRDGGRAREEGYHARVGAIEAWLKRGTTRGNPELVAEWNVAQNMLAGLDRDVGEWAALRREAAEADARAAFLGDALRNAFDLSGALESDHEALDAIGERVAHTAVAVGRLLNEAAASAERQGRLVAGERGQLDLLAEAIEAGSLDNGSRPEAARTMSEDSNGPLAVIRFDRPDVAYEQALSAAVEQALDRRPDLVFEIVGVAPGDDIARAADYADRVRSSLRRMGVPTARLRVATRFDRAAEVEEVRLYLR